LQRLLDFLFDLDSADRRGDPDLVDDVDDAAQLVHHVVGVGLLKLPIDLARHSAAMLAAEGSGCLRAARSRALRHGGGSNHAVEIGNRALSAL
jgi:hypothetical protein